MMKNSRPTIILLSAAMLMLNVTTSHAASIVQSSSNAISRSLATLSNSSATSSTNTANDLGQIDGDFQITKIAVADGSNDRMQIALQAAGDDRNKDINLYISAADYDHINLGVGQTVTARQQVYGVAFVRDGDKEPFTIVLADAWLKDLVTHEVAL